MPSREKYKGARPTQIRIQQKAFGGLMPGEMVVIPSPQDVEQALWEIPTGQTVTQQHLRQALAAEHDADNACPAMTGFQLRYVAEVAVDAIAAGVDATEVAPFWRVVDPDSRIAGRLPDGPALIEELRHRESDAT